MLGHNDSRRFWKLPTSAALGLLILFSGQTAPSYSILTHEAIVDSTAWGYIMRPAERKPNQNDLIVGADSFQRFTQMLSTCMKARVVMYQQEKASAGAPR